ncbi:putative spore germination protein GerPC [compost metagenome]
MNGYLDNEAPQKLHAYENELCIPLDPYHRRIIIEDVRKQLPSRIQHYLNLAYKGTGTQADTAELTPAIENVIAKTKRDADTALYAYMKQLTNGPAT